MFKKTGLRSEIIVNLIVLLGAALVFAGFLLLKLTERELIVQQVNSVSGMLNIVAGSALPAIRAELDNGSLAVRLSELFKDLPPEMSPDYWTVVDRDLGSLVSTGSGKMLQGKRELEKVRRTSEPTVWLNYPPAWLPFGRMPEYLLIVTIPVMEKGSFAGALQAGFSLEGIRNRMRDATGLIVIYVAMYGAVLVLFGAYLLNRTVVRPIRLLRLGTQQVAAGDLNHSLQVAGPSEIADLAGSFNAMIKALKASREETEATIVSLREANEDLRRTRDELIRSEKMASVGHLAAGMAHEVGNPLGAVVGYLELLHGELPSGREKEILERSLAEVQRIDRLVRDLLDYASPASAPPELLDPVTVLAEARDILTHQGILADLHLVDNLPSSLPVVCVSRHKLLQVFVNLILNARDASSPEGTIHLEAGVEGNEVRLSVTDEGTGMSPEVMAHIFDPFYTTKPPDKGKGLGLSVCYRVIEEAGGRIEVRSTEAEGSTFTVWLKRAKKECDEA
jgi:signal transduction histidine kinase